MRFGVDIGVVWDEEFDFTSLNEVLSPWDDQCVSAGSGFGVRDVQIEFDTEVEAIKELPKIKQAVLNAGMHVDYCTVYAQEQTYEEWLQLNPNAPLDDQEEMQKYFEEAE